MVGALFTSFTVKSNAGKESANSPSLTLITIPVVVPTSPCNGVPDSSPVDVSKLDHVGWLTILNVKGSFSGSLAVGVKL